MIPVWLFQSYIKLERIQLSVIHTHFLNSFTRFICKILQIHPHLPHLPQPTLANQLQGRQSSDVSGTSESCIEF